MDAECYRLAGLYAISKVANVGFGSKAVIGECLLSAYSVEELSFGFLFLRDF